MEILGKQAGNDGWYWEMGVIVLPTTFGGAGTGATGAAPETTRFTVRLFQVADEE